MRYAAKKDRNHPEVVKALRLQGWSVDFIDRAGWPDLAVGASGHNFFLEVKDGRTVASKRRLTEAQKIWHAAWGGQIAIVESPEEAVDTIRNLLTRYL